MKSPQRSAIAFLIGSLLLALLNGCGGSSSNNTIPITEQLFYAHNVVFGNNSTLIAAGYNGYGQLGNGTLVTPDPIVNPVSLLPRVHGYAAGANQTIAFSGNSTMYAWGCNFRGRLGVGTKVPTSGTKAYSAYPIPIQMPNTVVSVASGWQHGLAVAGPNRSVLSWGANTLGQLGNGGLNNLSDFLSPLLVKGDSAAGTLDRVVQVAAGGSHSLALREDGTVWAWGDNIYGQLGYVTLPLAAYSLVPQQVMLAPNTPLTNVKQIVAAGSFSVAVTNDGKVWAWGYNGYGQLAQPPGNLIYSATPKQVMENQGTSANPVLVEFRAVKVSAGTLHVMALKADANGNNTGEIWGWGFNERGQLGMGDELVFRYEPAQATKVQEFMAKLNVTATDVYAFGNTSFARMGGKLYGWGDNGNGQLGQPVPTNSIALLLSPVEFKQYGL